MMNEIQADEALTVDELLARLEKIRAFHGGDIPVTMSNDEPVCRVFFIDKDYYVNEDLSYHIGPKVIIMDQYEDAELPLE